MLPRDKFSTTIHKRSAPKIDHPGYTVTVVDQGGKPRVPDYGLKFGDTVIPINRRITSIGRGTINSIDIRDVKAQISRLHARIEIQENNYMLSDMGSTNGTYLNNRPLEPKKPVRLDQNDVIRLAGVIDTTFDRIGQTPAVSGNPA